MIVIEMVGAGSRDRAGSRYNHWCLKSEREFRERVLGLALVVPAWTARLRVRLYTWMGPPPTAHRIFASRAPAMTWARNQLAGGLEQH